MTEITRETFITAITPLLNDAAIKAVTDHCEALEAMGSRAEEDRLLLNGLRWLLLNHARRKQAWHENQLAKP